MGIYQSAFVIAIFLLSLGFVVSNMGAEEYVDFNQTEEEEISEDELLIDLEDYDEEDYAYFSNNNDGQIVVNETEYEERSATDPRFPNVKYTPEIDDVDTIVVDVSIPDDAEGEIYFVQGLSFREIQDGENRFENRRDDGEFTVSWEADDEEDTLLNATLDDARLSDEPVETSGVVSSITSIVSVTSGYPYFNDVLLVAMVLVAGIIVIRVGSDIVPFV